FQPWAIAASDGAPGVPTLVAAGANALMGITIEAGNMVTSTLPAPPLSLTFPMILRHNGELILADHQQNYLVRWDIKSGKPIGTIGGPGIMPGQLGYIGGLTQDSEGRIYVADTVNRVIQRFGTDDKIDAVWTAREPGGEVGESR
ncbi:MAG: hypothetical protein M3014_01575, partial [Chloroflexota bacterium]|nr:hypothetical protein [Chloroflexota bacterium]